MLCSNTLSSLYRQLHSFVSFLYLSFIISEFMTFKWKEEAMLIHTAQEKTSVYFKRKRKKQVIDLNNKESIYP